MFSGERIKMEKKQFLFAQDSRRVYSCEEEDKYILEFLDITSSFSGLKIEEIPGKGCINNRVNGYLFSVLEREGIPNYFVRELEENRSLVKKTQTIPLEVIVRNISAGSFAKRIGMEEGSVLESPILEINLHDEDLGNPFINATYVVALKIATRNEIDTITETALKVNTVLKREFLRAGIDLVDFRLMFGRDDSGRILVTDEISPDTCRLWDCETHTKLDKDRFRRNLGNVEEAYREVIDRLGI